VTEPDPYDAALQEALDALIADWAGVNGGWRAEIRAQVDAVVGTQGATAEDLAAVDTDEAAGVAVLFAAVFGYAVVAAGLAVAEAAAQGVTIGLPDWASSDGSGNQEESLTLRSAAALWSGLLAGSYRDAAVWEAARIWQPDPGPLAEAERRDIAADVAERVAGHLAGLGDAFLTDKLGGALMTAERTGRLSVYEAGPTARFFASEVRDKNSCEPCRDVDGTEYGSLAEAKVAYPTGGYEACLGRLRCRGNIRAVWEAPG
jgi:hypothetical protein